MKRHSVNNTSVLSTTSVKMSNSEYNADELTPPVWMDKEFIQKVLRSSENDDHIELIDLKISPATALGDHFATIMFRATVDYRLGSGEIASKSIIIKTMAEEEGIKKDMLHESSIFKIESQMYRETIPKFEELLRKAGDDTKLGARMLYCAMEPKQLLIFEDLCPKGYEVIRDRMLNLEETKAAILKLAKWHAVSYKLGLDSDPVVTSLKEGLLDMPNFSTLEYITTGVEQFTNMLTTMGDFDSYIPLMKELAKDLIPRVIDIFHAAQNGEEGIFVLNHGDFHLKNMMFKKREDGSIDDVMLIDFQLCCYGPATIDLTYATFSLFNEDVRRNHRDEVIYYYITNFLDTLRKIGLSEKIPTVAEFHIEFLKNRKFDLFMLTTFFPIFNAFLRPKEYDLTEALTSYEYRKQFYQMPHYIDEIRETLPKYLHKGYLN